MPIIIVLLLLLRKLEKKSADWAESGFTAVHERHNNYPHSIVGFNRSVSGDQNGTATGEEQEHHGNVVMIKCQM